MYNFQLPKCKGGPDFPMGKGLREDMIRPGPGATERSSPYLLPFLLDSTLLWLGDHQGESTAGPVQKGQSFFLGSAEMPVEL